MESLLNKPGRHGGILPERAAHANVPGRQPADVRAQKYSRGDAGFPPRPRDRFGLPVRHCREKLKHNRRPGKHGPRAVTS